MIHRYLDVFRSFERHDVKYLIIGGIAAIIHGVPRMTFDLDILIEATHDNARRLLDALDEAKFGTASLTTPENLLAMEIVVFDDRVRIDVQTATPGLVFVEAWARRQRASFGDTEFYVVSREDLLSSKRAAGRPIDLDDIRALEAGQAEA
ncbi:MAG TPA: nucleotidyltransferase [Candidatus Brocadiia bacterium]|nr:nucleotidyltransferase [Candidatus Brocadiia bacterium]